MDKLDVQDEQDIVKRREKRMREYAKHREEHPEAVEMEKVLTAYAEKFGTFPTYIFTGGFEEMMEAAKECLKRGKDVYELGYLTEPKDMDNRIY